MTQAKNIRCKQAIKLAQTMDCVQFYKQYEKFIEDDEVENICNYNEGLVNLIYHGTDQSIAILFINGAYTDWSYCS